tara:strand:- start:131 stop:583 length:453 start_codon:yes stop_codon:yes gene_type:complete
MKKYRKIKYILPVATIFIPSLLFAHKAIAGSFGAEIFCTMREGGNNHESSWNAAYTYIKKQKGGIFKVSPKQAAAQIVETVIREKESFIDCVQYLDKLNPDRKQQAEIKKKKAREEKEAKEREAKRKKLEKELEETDQEYSKETFDRYSY